MILCTLRLRTTATTEQLKALGQALRRWRDEERSVGSCRPKIDQQDLKDLVEGELPKPQLLRITEAIRLMNKGRSILGQEQQPLERHQLEQLREELGPEARNRDLAVHIECIADFGH